MLKNLITVATGLAACYMIVHMVTHKTVILAVRNDPMVEVH